MIVPPIIPPSRKKSSPRKLSHCGYCGVVCVGPTCYAHSDLIVFDPGAPKT
jgi:hypothetical protein